MSVKSVVATAARCDCPVPRTGVNISTVLPSNRTPPVELVRPVLEQNRQWQSAVLLFDNRTDPDGPVHSRTLVDCRATFVDVSLTVMLKPGADEFTG